MLYFKAVPNSIDFYKRIFFHVIHVRIIVPWLALELLLPFVIIFYDFNN